MGSPLTPRRSLESLKKDAKRWLALLRAGDPAARDRLTRVLANAPDAPTLRDVQHALAREHGFPGWAALKAAVTSAAAAVHPDLAGFEERAQALLEAYRTGTPEAMERHWRLTWHRRSWDGMRRYVRLDLGRQYGAPDFEDDITPDDARYLVAREHGYDSWDALVLDVSARPTAAGARFTAKPVEVLRPGAPRGENPERHSRDWRVTLAALREPSVEGLDAHGQMTDETLAELAPLTHLTTVSLGGSRGVTDSGVRHLAGLAGLRHLDLSGTAVTDQGLKALGGLTALETLSLGWTRVTDAGLASLARLDRLRRVDLMGTRTGDGALRAFAGRPQLADFRSGNAVTDRGLAVLRDYPVFRTWQDGEESLELLGFDARPNYLLLRGSFTDRGMGALEGLDGLFALNLDARELGLGPQALAPLATLPHLAWFAFDATDESMPRIAELPHLRFLSCQDTGAGDVGFSALSRSCTIEYIWGRDCHNLGTRGFLALAGMPALRSLSVSCRNVGDEGIAALPSFPALRELMPMGVPDEGYRHIGRCEGLESLVLMYCREATDRSTEHLIGLPRLRSYFASYNRITDRTPALLATIPSLEQVTLDGCAGVSDAGIAELARLPALKAVSVSGPRVTREVAKVFPPGVRVSVRP